MIAGDYITPALRLVRVLGRGGMGTLWAAEHSGLGTQVAVKLISASFAENQDFVQRFRCEAMAAAKIKGPHIAQVLDHGVTSGGVPFIVMELLEGEDLRQRMKRDGPLNPPEVVAIVRQVAKALGRAHQLGIVHRDIKPDNIFLTDSDGELLVKVLDFGVAKVGLDDTGRTCTGTILGTPRYMSPEQFLSTRNVDFRADLWSLGAVVYHALTGTFPFHGESIAEIVLAVHSGLIPSARAVRPDLPEALDGWFEKAFSRDPAGRFASARKMAEELGLAMRGWSPSPQAGASAPACATVLMATLAHSSSGSLAGTAGNALITARDPAGIRARRPIVIGLVAITGVVAAGAVVSRAARTASSVVPAVDHSNVARRGTELPAVPPVTSSLAASTASPAETMPAASAVPSAPAPPPASLSPPRGAGRGTRPGTSNPSTRMTEPTPARASTALGVQSSPPLSPAPSPPAPPAAASAPAAPSSELPPPIDPYG